MTDSWVEWPRLIELINLTISPHDINPKEPTEKGYYEWIASKSDVRKALEAWLEQAEHRSQCSPKDSDKAECLRKEGNTFFKHRDYTSSLQKYTESAKYSPPDKDDFSLAVANRSAALFHKLRLDESLEDIKIALQCGYPEETSWKLHLRAAECHLKLRRPEMTRNALNKLRESVEKNSGKIVESKKKWISKVVEEISVLATMIHDHDGHLPERSGGGADDRKNLEPEDVLPSNEEFPYAAKFLVRDTCPSMGRRVLAGKPIKRGEILFVEKPFAWVPVTHGNNVSLCAHCCGCIDDLPAPCRGCTDTLYCNWTCWKDAWSYHRWECPGSRIGLWPQIGVSHLAFKTMLVSTTSMDLARFNDVHRLVTNVDKTSKRDLVGLAIASLMLVTYAERYTDFFDTIDIKKQLSDKFDDPSINFVADLSTNAGKRLYIGSIILRHSLQMLANAYAITKICGYSDESVAKRSFIVDEGQQRIATATYPSASLLNHSCDPTVINTFWRNWLVVKAIKDVAEGEEIFHCYGPYFKRMSKSKRQTELWNQYSFHCKCAICSDPHFDSYTERFEGFKCRECSGPSQRLSGNTHRCYDCGATGVVTFDDALKKSTKLFEQGMYHVDIEEFEAAIPCFEKSLAIGEKYLYKYNVNIALAHDLLGQCYCYNGRWMAAISHLEKSLIAIETRYGSDSVEVANELNKLTDVCIQYLGRTEIRSTGKYRETFIKSQKYVDRAFEIISSTSGHWDDDYHELTDKKEQLSEMLKHLRF